VYSNVNDQQQIFEAEVINMAKSKIPNMRQAKQNGGIWQVLDSDDRLVATLADNEELSGAAVCDIVRVAMSLSK
jgi:hypothetical protein